MHPTNANAAASAPSVSRGFPDLPVLTGLREVIAAKYPGILEGVMVVAVQHLLETTGSLFESLFSLGLQPQNTFVLGKLYSTCADVAERLANRGVRVVRSGNPKSWGGYRDRLQADIAEMWKEATAAVDRKKPRAIVVLDDGGFALNETPVERLARIPVRGVEQTNSGVRNQFYASSATAYSLMFTSFERVLSGNKARKVPVVEVASSAAKCLIEPAMISDAVFRRVSARALAPDATYGVVGLGHIGSAVARSLRSRGFRVLGFDEDTAAVAALNGVTAAPTIKALFREADFVFGCTGVDILAGQTWWESLEGRKTFASCSSHDEEFRTVLQSLNSTTTLRHPLNDRRVSLRNGEITILRGGFPLNFDGTGESVRAADIQMTRGLLLGGVVQAAVGCVKGRPCNVDRERLSGSVQQIAVDLYFEANPANRSWYDPQVLRGFRDLAWIAGNSGGCAGVPLQLAPAQAAGMNGVAAAGTTVTDDSQRTAAEVNERVTTPADASAAVLDRNQPVARTGGAGESTASPRVSKSSAKTA